MKSAEEITRMKGRRIVMLTAYNYPVARILEKSGVDMILVGDSGVMVELGKKSTKEAKLSELLTFTKAVRRGAQDSFLIGDMPIHTYDDCNTALANAKTFISAGADAVKIEGNRPETIKHLRRDGIEVMGHIGLTPQLLPDYRVQGRKPEDAKRLLLEAESLEKAGVFSIVLECIPTGLARKITDSVKIPTIGIGAGLHCDGQVLVTNDLLGMYDGVSPKFVRRYMDWSTLAKKAIDGFSRDVREGRYPSKGESYDA